MSEQPIKDFVIVVVVNEDAAEIELTKVELSRYSVPTDFLRPSSYLVPRACMPSLLSRLPATAHLLQIEVRLESMFYPTPIHLVEAMVRSPYCKYCSGTAGPDHECDPARLKEVINGMNAHMRMWHSEAMQLADSFNVETFYHPKKKLAPTTKQRKQK